VEASQTGDQPTSTSPSSVRRNPQRETKQEDEFQEGTNPIVEDSYRLSMMPSSLPITAVYGTKTTKGYSPKGLFGVPIEFVKMDEREGIPFIISVLVDYVERNGLQEEGILRLAGSKNSIQKMRKEMDSGDDIDISVYDIHTVAGVLKQYIRELPKPILLMTRGLKEVIESSEPDNIERILKTEMENIPDLNYRTLKVLFRLMKNVSNNESCTRMTPENLAVVFHPTMQLKMELIIEIIQHYDQVFIK